MATPQRKTRASNAKRKSGGLSGHWFIMRDIDPEVNKRPALSREGVGDDISRLISECRLSDIQSQEQLFS